jgi:hypothetical protein
MADHTHDDLDALEEIALADLTVANAGPEPFPRRGHNEGPGPHVTIPETYTPGAIGWCARRITPVPGRDEDVIHSDAIVQGATRDELQRLLQDPTIPGQRKSVIARAMAALSSAHPKTIADAAKESANAGESEGTP